MLVGRSGGPSSAPRDRFRRRSAALGCRQRSSPAALFSVVHLAQFPRGRRRRRDPSGRKRSLRHWP
eukprot:9426639-Prorocentrum_lima.AAC.1